jgi:hypothetical protein
VIVDNAGVDTKGAKLVKVAKTETVHVEEPVVVAPKKTRTKKETGTK